jgi:hypothetical protein
VQNPVLNPVMNPAMNEYKSLGENYYWAKIQGDGKQSDWKWERRPI